METDSGLPLDDKTKRMRDLLSSFYSPDVSSTSPQIHSSSRFATLDTINTSLFDVDQYMNLLVQKSNLEELLLKHMEMAAEIKNLDTDLQMLVYENYNKFICATDTIKRMKNNITGMETNMERLLEKIVTVQSRSDGVDKSLYEKRDHIEKLHCTRNLLRKVQFIYDLPTRLEKCIKSEAYADAVKFYIGAMPIFKVYGDSSFQDCKQSSEKVMSKITENLQGKVFSDSASIQSRAEAVMLLKQLNFPVENLKIQLFEKLEKFLVGLHNESNELENSSNFDESFTQGSSPDLTASTTREAGVREFTEAVRAYKIIFLNSEQELSQLVQNLITKHFEAAHRQIKNQVQPAYILATFRAIWNDVLLLDEVLPEASLPDFSYQSVCVAVKEYISSVFNRLLSDISDALIKVQIMDKDGIDKGNSLQVAMEACKKSVIQGSMNVLLNFRQLQDENTELLVKLGDLIIDWIQEGFQDFFRKLNEYFLLLSGKKNEAFKSLNAMEGIQGEKIVVGLVLVLAQLSVVIEQSAIPIITEEIKNSFSGGGTRSYEYGPAFVPADISRIFQSSSELLLNLYVKLKIKKLSVLFKKRFTATNWSKHKEPREVHMFVDLLLQEFEEIRSEVTQILPQGLHRKHRRGDSNGSTTSSRNNSVRDDRLSRSNTQKARSQLLESHLAKLFKQKMEIFTKIEHTQDSVLTTIVKLSLKSLHEFVRLQTFNRSGFQQIQLDTHFLKITLKDIAEDEAAVDFLLDEVIVGTAERCLDPIPLEPPILERLVQAKFAKTSEQTSIS